MLGSLGHSQKWPTSGRIGYVTPAVWGVPNASERGTESALESALAHKCADWQHHPCCLGVPNASERGIKSAVAVRIGEENFLVGFFN